MKTTRKNYRFSDLTIRQLNSLVQSSGAASETDYLTNLIAVEYGKEIKMNKRDATQLAKAALEVVTVDNPEPIEDATVLFLNADGTYSVTDNGEEVDGLDKAGAVRIIVENLTGQ